MLNSIQEQYDNDVKRVKKLFDIKPVNITVTQNPELLINLLSQLLNFDKEKIEFFMTYVLGDNSELIIVEIEGDSYLTIKAYDPYLDVSLYLPIENISFKIRLTKDGENIVTESLSDYEDIMRDSLEDETITERVDIAIEYIGMFWKYKDDFFDFVDHKSHECNYGSKGTRTRRKRRSPTFTSSLDGISAKNPQKIYFHLALPIGQETVASQLHENGHYYDLHIAGNKLLATPYISKMLALSASGLDFIPHSKPLDQKELESILNLKSAEVRAWLYANYLLKRLGSETNLLNTGLCIESLKSYDNFLAPQVLSGDVSNNTEYFLFSYVAEEQLKWMNYFKQLKQLVIYICNLNKKSHNLDELGLSVEIDEDHNGKVIQIKGDDTELIFDITDTNSTNIIWVSLRVINEQKKIIENYRFSLNNSNDLKKCGENVFLNWIGILKMIKAQKDLI